MTDIELPKDAKGHEIPLDTKVLYFGDGSAHNVAKWTVYPYESIGWTVTFKDDASYNIHDPESVYLTPPDTWEKLFEDLKAVKDYEDSSSIDNPVCRYVNMVNKPCSECEFYGGANCICMMCADIVDRICKLRGEG